ncbi:MAG: hypothetical protein ABI194_01405 [Gemmatimonadaceae bacterium]
MSAEPGAPESRPPAPPRLARAFRLTTVQRVGLPALFAIPILALFGVFGERYTDARASGVGLTAAIHYPSRIHYRQPLAFRITIENTGADTADSVVVSLDPRFMRAFTSVEMSAPMSAPYRFTLRRVAPHERVSIDGEVSGDRYWRSTGALEARGPEADVHIPVATFVFP